MKKFLATLLIVGSLFFASTVNAEVKTYEGFGEYVMGERDTLETAKQGAKDKALRNALERAGVLIQAFARTQDSELVEDMITSQTGAILKVVDIIYDREDFLVKAHVWVEIDADDLNRRLTEIANQRKPAPPIDRPKPIETPAQPVESTIQTFVGNGSVTMSEDESLDQAVERAKTYATKKAQEQAGVYIQSSASARNTKISDSEFNTLVADVIKITDSRVRKVMTDDGIIQVSATITVELDTEKLQSELSKLLDKRNSVDGETYIIKIDDKLVESVQANGIDHLAEVVIRDGITYLPVVPMAKILKLKLDWFPKLSSVKTKYGSAFCYEKSGQLYCNVDVVMILFNIEGGLQTNADGSKIFYFKSLKG